MGEEDLDFSEIQKIFSNREARDEEKAQEKRSQLKLVKGTSPTVTENKSTKRSTVITPTSSGLNYKKVELRNQPEYDEMTPTNLKITKKAYELAALEKLALVVCTVVVVTAIGILTFLGVTNNKADTNTERPAYSTTVPNYGDGTNIQDAILNPADCNLSDFTIVLRRSTANTNDIVSVAQRELEELGVDNRVVTDKENIAEVVSDLKEDNPNREIIVINVDGIANQSANKTVIMTDYSNSGKSADNLAIAINNSANDIYGINSEIRCGKKTSTGNRTATSVEAALREAGHDDVICLTIAPSTDSLDDELQCNNIATIITEGVMRLGAIDQESRYSDTIRRVEFGDTISVLAEDNGVSQDYIKRTNKELLDANNGILQNDSALVVGSVHKNLTSSININNPTITTNPSDITTQVRYYEVKLGDTLSEIAEQLGISQSNLVVPSGNPDKIYPGDKIGYETEVGKILVSKLPEAKRQK